MDDVQERQDCSLAILSLYGSPFPVSSTVPPPFTAQTFQRKDQEVLAPVNKLSAGDYSMPDLRPPSFAGHAFPELSPGAATCLNEKVDHERLVWRSRMQAD